MLMVEVGIKLETNQRYQAEVELGIFEAIAPNATIENKLKDAGFVQVQVIGKGNKRTATGMWIKPTQIAELPKQIKSISKL